MKEGHYWPASETPFDVVSLMGLSGGGGGGIVALACVLPANTVLIGLLLFITNYSFMNLFHHAVNNK